MSRAVELKSFLDVFSQLEDPRVERTRLYTVSEILLTTLCGVIAGCDGWADIELFAKQRLDFLRQYLPFENGTPSDDTLRRFFRAVDPQRFQTLFAQWVSVSGLNAPGQSSHIAIDGKTSRGSADGAQRALHLVSAYASETRLVLGQRDVSGKSNEITAIPLLLDLLDLRGSTLTLDAMGCQHTIADRIIAGGGHYLISLKGNQGCLHQNVVTWFERPPPGAAIESFTDHDKGHGRLETRQVSVCNDVQWLHDRHPNWQSIGCIIELNGTRQVGERIGSEKRYYIGSRSIDAQRLLGTIRAHWAIENSLHWVLDMSFGEDQSRIRRDNAPANIAVIRHAVLNAINAVKTKRTSIKQMRKLAGWDQATLQNILTALV